MSELLCDESEKRARICPACGGANRLDAVFCQNSACHKALGEFPYVQEVLRAEARWHERAADKATVLIGHPHFLWFHAVWISLWVALNTGVVMLGSKFDTYPFGLLGLVLAVEAVFITSIVLISQNRQNIYADKRAELDYEVNVRTYREINEIYHLLHLLLERSERRENRTEEDSR